MVDGVSAFTILGRIEDKEGRPDRAQAFYREAEGELQAVLEKNPNRPYVLDTAARVYAYAGDKKKASEYAEELARTQANSAWYLNGLVSIYAVLGDKERALDYLEKSIEAGWDDARTLKRDPDLENIREDPRFKELVASIK